MIVYKDILVKLKNAGYSSYRLRKDNLLTPSVISRLRHNLPVTTDTLDIICNLLHCNVNEVIEHIENPENTSEHSSS